MMKRLFYLLIAVSLLLVGCFEDDSNKDILDLNPIVIETDGGNQVSVKQLDTLKIEPLVYCKGVKDSDLSSRDEMESMSDITGEIRISI